MIDWTLTNFLFVLIIRENQYNDIIKLNTNNINRMDHHKSYWNPTSLIQNKPLFIRWLQLRIQPGKFLDPNIGGSVILLKGLVILS